MSHVLFVAEIIYLLLLTKSPPHTGWPSRTKMTIKIGFVVIVLSSLFILSTSALSCKDENGNSVDWW